VIAFAVLITVIAPAAYLIQKAASVSTLSRQQLAAANLAQSQLEQLRSEASQSFAALAAQVGSHSSQTTIGTTTYSVSWDIYWTPGTSDPNGCSAGQSGSEQLNPILATSISVTWPNMAPLNPVRITSGFRIPPGLQSLNTGALLVAVTNQSDSPVAGVNVSVQPDSAGAGPASAVATDANGCAFFPFEPPGNYQVSLSAPSGSTYVDPSGNTDPSQVVVVQASQTSNANFQYAPAASVTFTPSNQSALVPWAVGVSLASPSLPGDQTRYFQSDQANNIFPEANYSAWLGSCYTLTSLPSNVSPPETQVTSGTNNTVDLLATPVTVTVTSNNQPVVGAEIQIEQTTSSGSQNPNCIYGSQPVSVGTTNSNGNITFLAPIGYMEIIVNDAGTTTTYPGNSTALDTTSGTAQNVAISL
jgi:hypothetical protein